MSSIKNHYVAIALASVCYLAINPLSFAADKPVKIGLLEDASGNFALPVIPKIHATELAVKEINAKGGIMGRPIELIKYD
jgi:branched-chain amino acid transport system substrate-binding protein